MLEIPERTRRNSGPFYGLQRLTSAFEIGIILKEKNYHLEYLEYVQMRKEAERQKE